MPDTSGGLKDLDLPSLPTIATQLLQRVDDPKTNVADLVELIQADVSLTAKVLRLVNSAFYGFPGTVSTLEKAIPLIGFHALKQLCLGLSLVDTMKSFNLRYSGLEADPFWEHCYATAAAARVLAPYLRLPQPEEAFVSGLIHDVGKLVFAAHRPHELAKAISLAKQKKRPLFELEAELTGVSHAKIGATLARSWQLPLGLVASIRYHHGGFPREDKNCKPHRPLVTAVTLGNYLAKGMRKGDSGCTIRFKTDILLSRVGVVTTQEANRIDTQIRESVREFQNLVQGN